MPHTVTGRIEGLIDFSWAIVFRASFCLQPPHVGFALLNFWKVTFLFKFGGGHYKPPMNEWTREAAVKQLVGNVIIEWREKRLKIFEEAFAERYNISDRFVHMIQTSSELVPDS